MTGSNKDCLSVWVGIEHQRGRIKECKRICISAASSSSSVSRLGFSAYLPPLPRSLQNKFFIEPARRGDRVRIF